MYKEVPWAHKPLNSEDLENHTVYILFATVCKWDCTSDVSLDKT